MQKTSSKILIWIACALVSACAPIIAVPFSADRDAPPSINNNKDLLLSAGDTLKVTIYEEENLTGEYTIDASGNLTLPMVGAIPAQGLSVTDLQTKVRKEFKKSGYLSNPLITVDIINMRPYYIMGEVKTPGSYPYKPSQSVFQAIAGAGGYTPRAAKNRILITRKQGDKTIELNARENTPILPGDSITVRERIL